MLASPTVAPVVALPTASSASTTCPLRAEIDPRSAGAASDLDFAACMRVLRRRYLSHVQREVFVSSTPAVEPAEIALLKKQIARFLHKHKDDDTTAQ